MLKVGDIVQLNKDDAGLNWIMRAEIIHTPRDKGDPFGFRDLGNGREVYTLETFTAYVLERSAGGEG
jgi:hypothetical protein